MKLKLKGYQIIFPLVKNKYPAITLVNQILSKSWYSYISIFDHVFFIPRIFNNSFNCIILGIQFHANKLALIADPSPINSSQSDDINQNLFGCWMPEL